MSPRRPEWRLIHRAALAQPCPRRLTRRELALAAALMRSRRHLDRDIAATLHVRERDVPALLREARQTERQQQEVTAA